MEKKKARKYKVLIRRIGIFIFVLLFIFFCIPGKTLRADEVPAETEIIYIDKAQDLYDLSGNASKEMYSKNKIVVFRSDIVVNPHAFSPIPVFCGRIEGNFHTVRGIEINKEGSNIGFVRVLEEGAQIKDLNIEGKILPTGSKTAIGGIVGTNKGNITACSFLGKIEGTREIGGIAALNMQTGSIDSCINYADVSGNSKVGGIVGLNYGVIRSSENRGDVNTKLPEIKEEESFSKTEELESLETLDIYEMDPRFFVMKELNTDDLTQMINLKVGDIGGISGMSYGSLEDCSNYANIGYRNAGNYIGGICGRQNGIIRNCSNYSEVRGKSAVGGIVGQFEPYLIVEYDEDTIDRLKRDMDQMSSLKDNLKYQMRESMDQASDNADRIRNLNKEVRYITEDFIDKNRVDRDMFLEDFDKKSSELEETIDKTDVELLSEDSKELLHAIRENLRELTELRNKLSSMEIKGSDKRKFLREYIRLLTDMKKNTKDLAENAKDFFIDGTIDAEAGSEDLKNHIKNIEDLVGQLDERIELYRNQLLEDMDVLDEDIGEKSEQISKEIENLNKNLKDGRIKTRQNADSIDRQINVMRDTLEEGESRSREEMERAEKGEMFVFDDVSELDLPEVQNGVIESSSNYGCVFAHSKGGGIAGAIGIDIAFSDDNIEKDGKETFNTERKARALIKNSINYEDISVEASYAGGIVGKTGVGLLDANINYGNIWLDKGEYAGGIAGKSVGKIRDSKVMSYLSGGRYVGGVVGYGDKIENNKVMVSFAPENGEFQGSIAGDIEEEGYALQNIYVENSLGAIDGITYAKDAKALNYAEFISAEDIPEKFRSISVNFIADGKTVKTIRVNYEDSLDFLQFPEVPEKEGFYGSWEEKDLSLLKHNIKIEAIYSTLLDTIASSEDALPVMLAEGKFIPDSKLNVTENTEYSGNIPKGYELLCSYQYEIVYKEKDGKVQSAETVKDAELPLTLRVLTKDLGENIEIAVPTGDEIRILTTRRDGFYTVFEGDAKGEFMIVDRKKFPFPYFWIPGGVGLIGLSVYLTFFKKKTEDTKKNEQEPLVKVQEDKE